MKTYIEIVLYALIAAAIFAGLGYYLIHIWSDCLSDNSILTCMRMLNK